MALALFAYDQGGAFAVGLVGFLRMLPGALAAPFGFCSPTAAVASSSCWPSISAAGSSSARPPPLR